MRSRPVANPVMRAGLEGIVSLIQGRISRELGLIRPPDQGFWRPVTRALELAAREMCEAKLERDEATGRSDAALADFSLELAAAVNDLLIPTDKRERLQGMIYGTVRAGLAGLCPAVVEHIEEIHTKEQGD